MPAAPCCGDFGLDYQLDKSSWDLNPGLHINDAAVVGLIPLFSLHNNHTQVSKKSKAGSMTDAVMYVYRLIVRFVSWTIPETEV